MNVGPFDDTMSKSQPVEANAQAPSLQKRVKQLEVRLSRHVVGNDGLPHDGGCFL